MEQENLTGKEAGALGILFLFCSSLVLPLALNSGQDGWLALALGAGISLPLVLAYARIQAHYPGENLFQILQQVYGKLIGNLLSLLYVLYALFVAAVYLRFFIEFVKLFALRETPELAVAGITLLLVVWGVKEGLEILGVSARLLSHLLFPALAITLLLLIPKMELENILPVMTDGFPKILQGGIYLALFPFTELIILSMAISSFGDDGSSYRMMLSSLLWGGLGALAIILVSLLVLGPEQYQSLYFPFYITVSRIQLGEFIQRIEIVVGLSLVIASFFKFSLCLLAAARGIQALSRTPDYRFIVIPLVLLLAAFSRLIYSSLMEFVFWAFSSWPLYIFPFQVLLPLITLGVVEWKARLQKAE
ncbi:MAG: endospore germination permease [Halanaerobium sp.]|nr:endospore germination permease [Halanaerobium sp.]